MIASFLLFTKCFQVQMSYIELTRIFKSSWVNIPTKLLALESSVPRLDPLGSRRNWSRLTLLVILRRVLEYSYRNGLILWMNCPDSYNFMYRPKNMNVDEFKSLKTNLYADQRFNCAFSQFLCFWDLTRSLCSNAYGTFLMSDSLG